MNTRKTDRIALQQALGKAARAISLFVIVAAGLPSCSTGAGQRAEFEWNCVATTPTSLQCTFDLQNGSGELCLDVVIMCSDGEHVQNVCTGKMEAKGKEQRVVSQFRPALDPVVECQGIEYRNKKIR